MAFSIVLDKNLEFIWFYFPIADVTTHPKSGRPPRFSEPGNSQRRSNTQDYSSYNEPRGNVRRGQIKKPFSKTPGYKNANGTTNNLEYNLQQTMTMVSWERQLILNYFYSDIALLFFLRPMSLKLAPVIIREAKSKIWITSSISTTLRGAQWQRLMVAEADPTDPTLTLQSEDPSIRRNIIFKQSMHYKSILSLLPEWK